MDKEKIKVLLTIIEANARDILICWRAWSDEEYYIEQIIKDIKTINHLLDNG